MALLVATGVQRPPEGVTFWPGQSQHAISLAQFMTNLIDVTTKADWQSPLMFGLAPLALLVRRWRGAARWLWLFVGYLFLQWWLLTMVLVMRLLMATRFPSLVLASWNWSRMMMKMSLISSNSSLRRFSELA